MCKDQISTLGDSDVSDYVSLTDYFNGGKERRKEMLAQPEAYCSCPDCACSCPQCHDCNCGIACNVGGGNHASNSQSLTAFLSKTASEGARSTQSSADWWGEVAPSWGVFFGG